MLRTFEIRQILTIFHSHKKFEDGQRIGDQAKVRKRLQRVCTIPGPEINITIDSKDVVDQIPVGTSLEAGVTNASPRLKAKFLMIVKHSPSFSKAPNHSNKQKT